MAPTIMPISAALLKPLDVAAAAEDVGGGGAADVDDADVEDAEVEDVEGVCWALADLTSPMPDWAAPMKALSGSALVVPCASALLMLLKPKRVENRSCLYSVISKVIQQSQ